MKLSIVICAYNRDKYIRQVIQKIEEQTCDKKLFELVIVNNNSSDNTDAICREFEQNRGDLQYQYVIEKKPGLSNARNCGIVTAKGDSIVFIDDDALAEPEFAANIIKHFDNNPDVDAMGGKILPLFPDNKEPEWLSPYLYGLVAKIDHGDKVKVYTNKYPAGCNMAFRKHIFDEIGMFNPDIIWRNDDKYIFLQIKKFNKKVLYVPDAVVHHIIDAFRLEEKFLDKIIFSIGSSERVRLQNESFFVKARKALEYFIKFGASFIFLAKFLLIGQAKKGTYLVYVRWNVFLSFFQKA